MKNMRHFQCFVVAVMVLMAASCGEKRQENTDVTPVVKVEPIRVAGEARVLQFPGRVVAASEVRPAFKVAGTLKKVYVREGDMVRQGQLIAEMDDTDYRVQLSATEAEYTQIKAEAERVMGLYNDGGTTASNYDKARYGLQQIEAKLQHHRNQLSYTKIYAPISGAVQTRFFEGGETVAAGMPIVSLLSAGSLEVEVNLPPVSYNERESFSSFTCHCDVMHQAEIPLQLISILPCANTNQLYTMRLKLDSKKVPIAAGMTVWVKIARNASEETEFIVPTVSLLRADNQVSVFVLDQTTMKVQQKPVKVVFINTDGEAKVVGDLQEGQQVVRSGIHHISDGVEVKVVAEASKTNVGGLL